jgi:hypothetical protein
VILPGPLNLSWVSGREGRLPPSDLMSVVKMMTTGLTLPSTDLTPDQPGRTKHFKKSYANFILRAAVQNALLTVLTTRRLLTQPEKNPTANSSFTFYVRRNNTGG